MAPSASIQLRCFRIEQLGEARIVGHVLEIGVAARLDAVLRIELDGGDQVLQALLGLAGNAVEDGEAVVCVIGRGVFLEDAIELVTSILVISRIKERNGVVILLAGRRECERGVLGLDRKSVV